MGGIAWVNHIKWRVDEKSAFRAEVIGEQSDKIRWRGNVFEDVET